MRGELAIAIAELNETVELLNEAIDSIIEAPSCSPDEIIEKVAGRNPSLIEQAKAMQGPPKNTLEFWMEFGFWNISKLRDRYGHIWPKVARAYWNSDLIKRLEPDRTEDLDTTNREGYRVLAGHM